MTAKRDSSDEIDAVAADWAARVDRAALSRIEQADLDRWLAADSRRFGAYAKARAVFAHARRARALGPNFDHEQFAAAVGPFAMAPAPLPHDVPSRRRFLAVGGAAAAGVALTAGLLFSNRAVRFATDLGEVRAVPLADGSTVTLNTNSRIAVNFTDESRSIRLLSGEALFDVAKDRARPFVVEAGDTQVRAVGTSFTVSRLDRRPTAVLVREGVVEVSRGGGMVAPGAPLIRLEANTRAIAAMGGTAMATNAVSPTQVVRELAWREGMLSFEDMRLDQAAAEFARYSDTHIVITDPAIAAQTVTGLFAARNPTGFAETVATVLDLRAEAGPGVVALRRRAEV